MTQPSFGTEDRDHDGSRPSSPVPQPGDPSQSAGVKRKKWPWVVGAVVMLFAIIGVAGGVGSDEKNTAAPLPSVVETRTVTVDPTTTSLLPPQSTTEEVATETPTSQVVAPPPLPTTRDQDAGGGMSSGERNAKSKASDYLALSAFSRSGLIEQLEYEDFSTADATAGVDSLDVDWMEQAEKKAKEYLDLSSFSQQGLVEQLVYEGFTQSQAEHGAQTQY